MNFYSTRSPNVFGNLKTALLQGLAPDGGLYLPEHIPTIAPTTWQTWHSLRFAPMAAELAPIWFGEDLDSALLQKITREAYTFDIPIRKLGVKTGEIIQNPISLNGVAAAPLGPRNDNSYCCELFHGPSLSFKDIAAQFLMRTLDAILERDDERALVLTATSGDTGSAVAAACHGRKRIRAIVLYPRGRISRIQEQQIATWGGNVQAVSVAGTFDDCQRLVKARLAQFALTRDRRDLRARDDMPFRHVTSANSINIGRLLPQTFYYWFMAIRHPGCVIVVPSGNIGNLTAGILAQRMGAPIAHFVAATNVNDSLPRFLQSGKFQPHTTHHTLSNAMDVGNPSNFERLNHLFGGDAAKMSAVTEGTVVSDDETRATMREVWEQHQYLMDPHTAVAWTGLRRVEKQFAGTPIIALGTADPAKFPELVQECTGQTPPVPTSLQAQMARQLQFTPLDTPTDTAFTELLNGTAYQIE